MSKVNTTKSRLDRRCTNCGHVGWKHSFGRTECLARDCPCRTFVPLPHIVDPDVEARRLAYDAARHTPGGQGAYLHEAIDNAITTYLENMDMPLASTHTYTIGEGQLLIEESDPIPEGYRVVRHLAVIELESETFAYVDAADAQGRIWWDARPNKIDKVEIDESRVVIEVAGKRYTYARWSKVKVVA